MHHFCEIYKCTRVALFWPRKTKLDDKWTANAKARRCIVPAWQAHMSFHTLYTKAQTYMYGPLRFKLYIILETKQSITISNSSTCCSRSKLITSVLSYYIPINTRLISDARIQYNIRRRSEVFVTTNIHPLLSHQMQHISYHKLSWQPSTVFTNFLCMSIRVKTGIWNIQEVLMTD